MINAKRLAVAPALAVAFAGLTMTPALASADALSQDAVGALAVASCQVDPAAPLTLEELNPVVLGETDVTVVPGEITAHVVRANVNTSLGEVQECTFGVLHRDALLPRVAYEGTASLASADTSYGATTEIELGNMGKGSPVDPTTELSLGGFLAPLESAVEDPTYSISVDRKAIEVVQIAVNRTEKDAAGRLLKAQVKAAAQLQHKQLKAAGKGKHAAKAVAAAHRAYDRRVAAAQAAYQRATTPKTISRPVSHNFAVTGSVSVAG